MGKVQIRKSAPVSMHTDFSVQGEICVDAPRDEVRSPVALDEFRHFSFFVTSFAVLHSLYFFFL